MTDQATGALSKLVMGFETTFGTLADDGFIMPIVKSTLKATRNKTSSPVLRGDYNAVKPTGGNYTVAGQITVPMDSVAIWYWLKAAFNSLTTTGAGPYVHAFKMTGITKRGSITIEHQFLDLDTPKFFQYTGCKISGMSGSVGGEGELLLNLDIVGSGRTIAAASFDAAATDVTWSPLDNSQASIKEGGSAFADSDDWNFNISFNPDTSKYLIGGGGKLGAIPDGIMKVTGKNNFLFKDTVLLEKAINGTETSLEITATKAADSKVVWLFPEAQYSETDPGIEGPQGIAIGLDWLAYYDNATEESSVVATITNGEAHA